MEIPDDIINHELWKYMSVDTILKYCSLNKKMNTICKNPDTWSFLLLRDFNVKKHIGNQRSEYMRLYNRRKYQSFDVETLADYLVEHNMDDFGYIDYIHVYNKKHNEKGLEYILDSVIKELVYNNVTPNDISKWIEASGIDDSID